MHHSIFLFSLLFLHCTSTFSQSPTQSPVAAPPPAKAPAAIHPQHTLTPLPSAPPPPGPTDVIQVLLKANHFLTFVRLIKATHVDYQLSSQLNSSTDGITIFAPTDTAFSKLKSSVLGSLNDKQKVSIIQYHILPRYLNISDFQTLSNPVETLAGSVDRFPMTISTTDSAVILSTGITKTSVSDSDIVYTDKQVAIYGVDKVLQPKHLFPQAAAAAPSPAEKIADSPDGAKTDNDSSGAIKASLDYKVVFLGAAIFSSSVIYIM